MDNKSNVEMVIKSIVEIKSAEDLKHKVRIGNAEKYAGYVFLIIGFISLLVWFFESYEWVSHAELSTMSKLGFATCMFLCAAIFFIVNWCKNIVACLFFISEKLSENKNEQSKI